MTRLAALFHERLDPTRPPHVAVLLDNTPEYVFCLGGAALAGAAVVGLNHTRRDEHLLADIGYTDVQLLVTEPRHQELLEPVAGDLALPGGLLVSERFADGDDPPRTMGEALDSVLESWAPGTGDPGIEPDVETLWVLLFTSGTSSAPKAVRCTQRRLLTTGNRMTMVLDVGPDDVGYLAMPLFHSNSLMVGLAPALVAGASVGLARRFSASRFLDDVRRYGATWFNYTGKPLAYLLATPERPDDARQPAPAGLRQRRLTARGGGGGHALRRGGGGRVRLDRGRDRPRPFGRRAPGLDGKAPPGDQGGRPRRARAAACRVRRRGPARERRGVRGRDRQRRGGRPVRGLLPQRRGHGPHHPQRLVLERRPRIRRRRRLGVLRGAHLGLAPGRRRELPGRADRGHRGPPPRRHAGFGLRRARRRLRRPGDGRARAARGCGLRSRRLRRLGRRPERPEPQVAAPLRAAVPGPAHHAHQQGARAHARAPEVPGRPRRGGPGASPGPGRGPLPRRSGPRRSRRCTTPSLESGRTQAWDL